MLRQRLGLLENFLTSYNIGAVKNTPDIFQPEPGTLTIVDLTDTFIDKAFACTLFGICLDIFNQRHVARVTKSADDGFKSGIILTCDEAHKYLDDSDAAQAFTERLIKLVREQRHYGARVVVATQDPTISGSLLGLCNTSIVHRFNDPAWFSVLRAHLAGASLATLSDIEQNELFGEIVGLHAGEAYVFSPSSYVCVDDDDEVKRLDSGLLKVKTRLRLTHDAGESHIASG
ncbi:hypothetical protein K431DRAFT_296962 [Polychaeton citri CBS 116435]|uniref:AAA-like domain protein n=1 Tax=Polychaeton citri CBS 116435 TaxID=1314669 RepID=A0A9P4Q2P8_9PEZI|nr:hypothetical protein K431DRAFT_296962 [Polychaeton citri CBS 116435]